MNLHRTPSFKHILKTCTDSQKNAFFAIEKAVFCKHFLIVFHDQLLETNLLKLVESYSRVQISRIAELIELPADVVERKLSQMVLDETLSGVLSQGEGVLIIYEKDKKDETFSAALEFIEEMGHVVDSLYKKASTL